MMKQKKKAHDPHINRAKENLKLSYGVRPAMDMHQTPIKGLKLYIRAVIESEA